MDVLYGYHDAVYTDGSTVDVFDVTPADGLWLVTASIFDMTAPAWSRARVGLSGPSIPHEAKMEVRSEWPDFIEQFVAITAQSPVTLAASCATATAMSVAVRCVRLGPGGGSVND